MRRIFLAIALLISCTTTYAQTGEFTFSKCAQDSSVSAEITVGYDYIKLRKVIKTGPLAGYKLPAQIWGSSPNYNFSFGDDGSFWISRSSADLKILLKYDIRRRTYTYVRINGVEYRK